MSNHTPMSPTLKEVTFRTWRDDVPAGPRRLYVNAKIDGVLHCVRFDGASILFTKVEPGIQDLPALAWSPPFDDLVEGLTAVLHDALLELTGEAPASA